VTAKSNSKKARSPKAAQPPDTKKRIRRRAYEFYEERGRVDGFALDDWLEAEREILRAPEEGKAKTASTSRC
jgi:Protein of unknown function (DUF2934)